MILQEASPIVQLSYSWDALLISSEKRTVLWDFHSEKVTQVGQKERKRLVHVNKILPFSFGYIRKKNGYTVINV